MRLAIRAAELRPVRWPLAAGGPAIWQASAQRAGVLLRVSDQLSAMGTMGATGAASGRGERDGGELIGLGEASPLPRTPGDEGELAAATAALQRWVDELAARRGPLWLGELDDFDRLAEEVVGEVDGKAPAARFALETALLGLLARARRVPLAQLLHPAPAARVEVNAVVEDLESARAAARRGITTFKLKLGLDSDADARTLRAIRDELGPAIRLRGDANQGWPAAEVGDRLAALAAARLDYVEEPCRRLADALEAAAGWPVPVALDETAAELPPGDTERLLAHPAVAAFVAKPTRLGGLFACRRWAEAARRLGKPLVVTHTLEGPIAFAACAELSRALAPDQAVALAVGLDAHPGLAAWRVKPPQLGAAAITGARSGLGLEARWRELAPGEEGEQGEQGNR